MAKSKSITQIIKEASAGKAGKDKAHTGSQHSSTPLKREVSSPITSVLKGTKKAGIRQAVSSRKYTQQLSKLRDSLTELQASYGDLKELFNNTNNAKDTTISSLLQDLRYTVARLDKADFALRYDKSTDSLFVDGEDSISVSTPEMLAMLSYLTSLFPDKSIALSIDGDSDYTDEGALEKLTELSPEKPESTTSVVPEVTTPEGDDIDKVLQGVGGDSKIKDSEFEPENRFTCTYKQDTYSIWEIGRAHV